MSQSEQPGVARPSSNKDAVPTRRTLLRRVGRGAGAGMRAMASAWEQMRCSLANGWRRLQRGKLPDYVVITLDHAVAERAPTVPWWYAYVPGITLPLSLEYLETALARIAGDPSVRGVVFLVKGPTLTLPKAQSLAQILARFRAGTLSPHQTPAPDGTPKQIVVHLETAGAGALVLGAVADVCSMTPEGGWNFTGLRIAPLYLKDALARLGLEVEVAQISPWKSAFDPWQHAHMSPEVREQYSWLLDSLFDDVVDAVAQGRGLTPTAVKGHIDQAPLTPRQALDAGLVDWVCYEDELPQRLGTAEAPARLKLYAESRALLYRYPRRRHAKTIGVLSLQGSIVPGSSRRFPIPMPLVGDQLMGSSTVAYQVRAARKNPRYAAIVLHVDSGGGSAFASDLIWRELYLLAQEKPLIVYMGDIAASGGYYIATPGRQIVAQRATLTGSIGVVTAKPVTGGAAARLGANHEVIQRGANAGLHADDRPWTPAERAKVLADIQQVYGTFKQRVSEGRQLPFAGLDAIANGRVWTGKQALAHRLVDELGDFRTAVELACQAAELPTDGSVATVNIPPARGREAARPVQANVPAQALTDVAELARWFYGAYAGQWTQLLGHDRYWLWADGLPQLDE